MNFDVGIFQPADRFTIIGAGYVCCHRIIPALVQHGVHPSNISILSRRSSSNSVPANVGKVNLFEDDNEILRAALDRGSPVIVATWPDTHFFYASPLVESGVRVAIEKPLCCGHTCFEKFRRFFVQLRERGLENEAFCLGYYALEKALPLSVLFAPGLAKAATSLIEVVNGSNKPPADLFAEARDRLGPIRSLKIKILEGLERSPVGPKPQWTELPNLGGVLFDTFVHVLQLAIVILGEAEWLQELSWREGWHSSRLLELGLPCYTETPPHKIEAEASGPELEVSLMAGKFIHPAECKRAAELVFENGTILCDFDRQRCIVEFAGGNPICLQTRTDNLALATRYGIQLALMRSAFREGGTAYDLREIQLAAIKILLDKPPGEVFFF